MLKLDDRQTAAVQSAVTSTDVRLVADVRPSADAGPSADAPQPVESRPAAEARQSADVRPPADAKQSGEARRLPSPERHLTVTPLDMRQPRFATKMRGFDRDEVTAFLEEAATGYENALRENDRLRQDIVRLEASLNQFRELEGSLKSTLLSAQKVADDMRENANQEAARILREAESRADLLSEKSQMRLQEAEREAQTRLQELEREIDGMRLKRREAETNIEAIISTLHSTVDFVRELDRRERENRVVPHRVAAVAHA
jgi:cell division initiation protein